MVKSVLIRCEILLLQDTLLLESGSGVTVFVPAIRKYDVFGGRPSGGFAIFGKKSFKT